MNLSLLLSWFYIGCSRASDYHANCTQYGQYMELCLVIRSVHLHLQSRLSISLKLQHDIDCSRRNNWRQLWTSSILLPYKLITIVLVYKNIECTIKIVVNCKSLAQLLCYHWLHTKILRAFRIQQRLFKSNLKPLSSFVENQQFSSRVPKWRSLRQKNSNWSIWSIPESF